MSYRTIDGMITINATGVQVSSGAASAVVPIPNAADGNRARFIYIQTTGTCYVRPGLAGTTCTVNDIMVVTNEPILLNVQGFTHIAYLQETSAVKINISPLEGG